MVSLAVTLWGRGFAPSGPSVARLRFALAWVPSVGLISQKACRPLLGLDGPETRPYMVCAGPYTVCGGSYFAIGTFTPVFFAKSFASL
jgi:hypothetical protein